MKTQHGLSQVLQNLDDNYNKNLIELQHKFYDKRSPLYGDTIRFEQLHAQMLGVFEQLRQDTIEHYNGI